MKHQTADQFEVCGGLTLRGNFVALVCKVCRDGVTYWDEDTHGKPTLSQIANAATEHECDK